LLVQIQSPAPIYRGVDYHEWQSGQAQTL